MAQRLRVHIQGIVQGVEVDVEGVQEDIYRFLKELPESVPPRANITQIDTEKLPAVAYRNFEIKPSAEGAERATHISPDTDCFLLHDRDILLRSDDVILRAVTGMPRQIRRSRGYVPVPILLRKPVAPLLALGRELKGTICLTGENRAFVGQHLGDLENLETLEFLEQTVSHLRRIFEVNPHLLVHDLHPDYLTTQVAVAQEELPTVAVQHHHAHIVSCMAEHGLDGKVLSVALDGTGYGDHDCIWGGEILAADERQL